jgi:hypothetical protein
MKSQRNATTFYKLFKIALSFAASGDKGREDNGPPTTAVGGRVLIAEVGKDLPVPKREIYIITIYYEA